MTAGAHGPGRPAIVLHTHMPYVEGFGAWPFGEEWLWEASGSPAAASQSARSTPNRSDAAGNRSRRAGGHSLRRLTRVPRFD